MKSDERMFGGFSKKTISFLKGIGKNNTKAWFEKHRGEYEEFVLEPLRGLVTDMGPFMLGIDSGFEVTPAINKTISRIYRDVRFSKDKSPYRDVVWFVFKRPGKDWAQFGCGYFMELRPDGYRYGMGFYCAAPVIMRTMREMILEDVKGFFKTVGFLDKQDEIVLEGDEYKRAVDASQPERVQRWLQKKNVYLVCNRKIDDVLMSGALVDELQKGFKMIAPFYKFLLAVRERSLKG